MCLLSRRGDVQFIVLVLLVSFGLSHMESNQKEDYQISALTHQLSIQLYDIKQFAFHVVNFNKSNVTLTFTAQNAGVVKIVPESILLNHEEKIYEVSVETIRAGLSEVHVNSSDCTINVFDVYFIVTVYKSGYLDQISSVVGWIYVVTWSLSMYPQVITNYQRKSVIGLNFDFLALNIVGFTLYSVFNLGLYLIPAVEVSLLKDEYMKRYPRGLNPVKGNDIFLSVHAGLITAVTIAQCYVYEAGNQKISTAAKAILSVFAILLCCSLIISSMNSMNWLDFLNLCSYIKLVITLIKYMPQAYMNYKRKSTVGWSIGTSILDSIGGSFSMLQMILNAINYDDWVSIFGDATKMGLGIISVSYDIVFLIQHYGLYSHKRQTYVL